MGAAEQLKMANRSWKQGAPAPALAPFHHDAYYHRSYPHYLHSDYGLSPEEHEARVAEIEALRHHRNESLKELDRREMLRVVKESQVSVLGQADVLAGHRLQQGWSGNPEERAKQDEAAVEHPHLQHWDRRGYGYDERSRGYDEMGYGYELGYGYGLRHLPFSGGSAAQRILCHPPPAENVHGMQE